MERIIDLHTHSCASDGTTTPSELVILAKESGLAAMAITDHDTISGVQEALDQGEKLNIEVVPGVELSTEYMGVEVHVVGLYIDITYQPLIDQLKKFCNLRDYRNIMIIEKLAEVGFDINKEIVLELNPDTVIARPHIAKYLVDTGQAESIQYVFDNYIANGRPCFVDRYKITPFEAVELIHAAGGFAILAHPCLYRKLSDEQLEELVAKMASIGLDGIETRYSKNKPGHMEQFEGYSKKYNLLCSGGSDFHGTNKPDIHIGTGTGNLKVPYEYLQAIKEKHLG